MKHLTLFSSFCWFQNAILPKIWNLGFWSFKPIFFRVYLLLDTTFVLNFSCLFELIFEIFKMHLKQVSWVFNICHLTFEYKIVIVWVLILHILNYLSKTESSFQMFRRSLRDWFGPRCKCKGSIYLDNSKSATTLQWKLRLTLVFSCKFCTFRIILF